MTLKEILERLYSPTEHAITLKNGELTALLEELNDLREENKVLTSECDRLIKEKGELNKLKEKAVLEICRREARLKEAKQLLKATINDIYKECSCNTCGCDICECNRETCDYDDRFTWRHKDEALKLIGDEPNV